MDFHRADFGLFRDLVDSVSCLRGSSKGQRSPVRLDIQRTGHPYVLKDKQAEVRTSLAEQTASSGTGGKKRE